MELHAEKLNYVYVTYTRLYARAFLIRGVGEECSEVWRLTSGSKLVHEESSSVYE